MCIKVDDKEQSDSSDSSGESSSDSDESDVDVNPLVVEPLAPIEEEKVNPLD